MNMVIKGGTLAGSGGTMKGDLRVVNGIIAEIASAIEPKADETVIDAVGQLVLPGGIDLHTHFANKGVSDDFASGSRAAARGGITTYSCYVEGNKEKGLVDNFKDWKYRRAAGSCVDYMLVPVLSGSYISEFFEAVRVLKEEGVNAIKLFLAYRDNGLLVEDADLYRILSCAGKNGLLCNIHCENGDVIDAIVKEWVNSGKKGLINHGYTRTPGLEAEAVSRAVRIAQEARADIRIVHVSCREALEEVRSAKKKGFSILAETCPHYLVKDISFLDLPDFEGAKSVCAPPLREKYHQEHLWKGIRDGVITTVASDHAPVNFEGVYSKQLGRDDWSRTPNGCPGVEELYVLLYQFGVVEKRITLEQFVNITSTNPAKEFGIYPRKGSLSIGSDGDLVILDPNRDQTLSVHEQVGKTDYNAYEGFKVCCQITHVISRGEEIVHEGRVTAREGRGTYLG